MGGSARAWNGTLPAELVAGSTIQMHLVMTKFGPPSDRIAYAVSLQATA